MAVSNSIGSNVFDILIGLALPWFLTTAIIYPGSVAHINSNGLVFSVSLLFFTVIFTVRQRQRQTDRQTDRHLRQWSEWTRIICLAAFLHRHLYDKTNRETDRYTDGPEVRQTNSETDRQSDRHQEQRTCLIRRTAFHHRRLLRR